MAERLDQYDNSTIRLSSGASNQLLDDVQATEEIIAKWAETPYDEKSSYNPVWTSVEGTWKPNIGGIVQAVHTFTRIDQYKSYHALGSLMREYEFDKDGLIWRVAVKHWYDRQNNETLFIQSFRDESGIFQAEKVKTGADAVWQANYAFIQQRILQNKEVNESAIRVPNSLREIIFNLTSEPEYLG